MRVIENFIKVWFDIIVVVLSTDNDDVRLRVYDDDVDDETLLGIILLVFFFFYLRYSIDSMWFCLIFLASSNNQVFSWKESPEAWKNFK